MPSIPEVRRLTQRRGRTAPSADSRENRLLETAGTPGLGGLSSGHSTLCFCATAPSVAACLGAPSSCCCDGTVPATRPARRLAPLTEAGHERCPQVRTRVRRLGRGGLDASARPCSVYHEGYLISGLLNFKTCPHMLGSLFSALVVALR